MYIAGHRVRLGAPFLWRMQNLEKMFFPVTVPRRGMPPNPTPALPHRGREPFRCSSGLRFLREPPLPDCFRYWCAKAHPIELYPNSSAVGWGLPHRCTASFAATDVVRQGALYGSYLLGTLVALIPSPPTVPRPARRCVGVRGGRGGAAYSRGTPRRRAILARGG